MADTELADYEEQFLFLQHEIDRWLKKQGVDVDLDAMSVEELAAFWANPPVPLEDLEKFIDAVMTMQTFERSDSPWFWDAPEGQHWFWGDEGSDWGGFVLEGAMALPFFRWGRLGQTALRRLFPVGAKMPGWLGKSLGLTDDAGVVTTGAVASTPTVRAAGFGRVQDVAEQVTRSGPGGLGRVGVDARGFPTAAGRATNRTASGVGATIPRVADDVLAARQRLHGVVGVAAAGTAAMGVGRYLGGPNVVSTEQLHEEGYPGFEDEGFADRTPAEIAERAALREAEAAETEPASVTSIVDANIGIMKQIYYEGLSEEAAFDKLTNWVAGSGVNVLAESGVSLGAALEQQEQTQGGPLGDMHIYSLLDEPGRDQIRKYLQANWQRIDDLKNNPRMSAIPQWQAGAISGPMLPEDAAIDTVIEDYIVEISRNADFLLLAPEDPSGTGDAIGFITSFDGTTHGNVISFNDMFSGGRVGPMNFLPLLRRARPEQIAMWQQQLYAWGYLEQPPEVWGQITPDAQGNMHTLDAAHRWQVAVFNEGVSMVRDAQRASPFVPAPPISELVAADGTPRADRVLDRAIAGQMSGESTRATDARTMRDRVVAQAQDRVGKYLEATGRYLPEGSAMQIQSGLDQALSGLSAERQESAFGQGGSPYERALAESILGKLSQRNNGTGNWKDMLTFGTTNRDSSFFDYAARVGAVSERERDLLMAGVVNRGTYRDHWKDRHEQLKEAEADVAVAALLKFISQGMTGDFSTVTPTDIARGVNTYMHTVGMQQGLANPISESDLTFLAQEAIAEARGARFQQDNQMLTDVATGGVDQMGLRGGVSGYQFRDLVNQLDSIQSVRKLGVPNA